MEIDAPGVMGPPPPRQPGEADLRALPTVEQKARRILEMLETGQGSEAQITDAIGLSKNFSKMKIQNADEWNAVTQDLKALLKIKQRLRPQASNAPLSALPKMRRMIEIF